MKRVKIILFSFYLQNLQHSVQNNYIYLSGIKKLKEALTSLHDQYSEENPFAEAPIQTLKRFISLFICWTSTKQMTSRFKKFYFLNFA